MSRDDVEIVERRIAHDGFGRLTELVLRHRRFGGGMSDAIHREVYERRAVAAVLLYDPDRDTVVLVEQFRSGAYLADRGPWLIEIVAGLIDSDETAEAVARREAVEEAGCTITAMERIADVMTSPGATTERCEIFCGRIDSHGVGGIHGLAHEHEDIRVHVLARVEALAALAEGRVINAKSVIALQWFALNHAALRERWRAA